MPVTEGKEACFYIYITFTFIYLADTFIQRDLQLLYTVCQRSHASATRGKVSCSHSFTNLTNHIDRMLSHELINDLIFVFVFIL